MNDRTDPPQYILSPLLKKVLVGSTLDLRQVALALGEDGTAVELEPDEARLLAESLVIMADMVAGAGQPRLQ